MRTRTILLALSVSACGASSAHVDNTTTAEETTSRSASSSTARVSCDHGPFPLSMPIGDDAELEPSADDACALVPRGMTGANPFALAWTVALMFVPVGDAGPEREPPGTACTDAFRTAATETPSSRAS